jgi:hypothetical protein
LYTILRDFNTLVSVRKSLDAAQPIAFGNRAFVSFLKLLYYIA